MAPEERAESLVSRLFDATGTLGKYEKAHLIDGIAAEIRASVEEAFEERGHAFQNAIQKCLEEKRQAKAEAYENAAKIVETCECLDETQQICVAEHIRARAKEVCE